MLNVDVLGPGCDELAWCAAAAVLTEALHASAWRARHPVENEVSDTVMAAQRMQDQLAMLATWNGQPAGVLFVDLLSQGTVAFVRWVAVHPAYRRRGVATRLLDELQRQPGLERVEGMVERADPAATGFWTMHGWTSVSEPPSRIRMGRSLTAKSPAP
jgi:GNAT superfamily N-acetyltransferase